MNLEYVEDEFRELLGTEPALSLRPEKFFSLHNGD